MEKKINYFLFKTYIYIYIYIYIYYFVDFLFYFSVKEAVEKCGSSLMYEFVYAKFSFKNTFYLKNIKLNFFCVLFNYLM